MTFKSINPYKQESIEEYPSHTSAEIDVETVLLEDGRTLLGVLVDPTYEFPFDVSISIENIGGPSAGMVFALGMERLGARRRVVGHEVRQPGEHRGRHRGEVGDEDRGAADVGDHELPIGHRARLERLAPHVEGHEALLSRCEALVSFGQLSSPFS